MMQIKDVYFRRIMDKFDNEEFTMGNVSDFPHLYIEGKTIYDIPSSQRTPEVCAALMKYGKCKLRDVPIKSRTRDFFIDSFTNKDVNDFIKSNISLFDRDFFKDLIVSNHYSTHFDTNCFNVMPLEYIDEEMVSLAIIHTQDWSSDDWFISVMDRNIDAISNDVWKLAARLYGRMSNGSNVIVDRAPESVKDEEFYRELCLCNYNAGSELDTNKGRVMDLVPDEMLTSNFIVRLLNDKLDNIARFNEKGLNMSVPCGYNEEVIVWKYVVRNNGYLIRYIPLNEERINYFLELYPKNSSEYKYGFKDAYKSYLRKQEKKKEDEELRYREEAKSKDIAQEFLMHAFLFAMEGDDPSKAIDIVSNRNKVDKEIMLPINFRGFVPDEYELTHDSEEYLEMVYKQLGIEIIRQEDSLFYRVSLPEGWNVTGEGYHYAVVNENNDKVIEYFYCSKFYDMDAYVTGINVPDDIKRNTL